MQFSHQSIKEKASGSQASTISLNAGASQEPRNNTRASGGWGCGGHGLLQVLRTLGPRRPRPALRPGPGGPRGQTLQNPSPTSGCRLWHKLPETQPSQHSPASALGWMVSMDSGTMTSTDVTLMSLSQVDASEGSQATCLQVSKTHSAVTVGPWECCTSGRLHLTDGSFSRSQRHPPRPGLT